MSRPRIEAVKDAEGDFALRDLSVDDSVNIACGAFVITIQRTDVGIAIDVYPQAMPADDPLASLQAWDEDALLADE